MTTTKKLHLKARGAVVLVLPLMIAACGTQVPREEIVTAFATPTAEGGRAATERDSMAAGEEFDGLGAEDPAGNEAGMGVEGPATADGVEGLERPEPGPGAIGEVQPGTLAPAPEAQQEAQTAPGAPIRIGSVSQMSGAAGAAQRPGVDAVRVWVRWINDRGGINGHPVEYLVVDDGGDPARHQAAVRQMVENQGVIAFVGQYATLTSQAARSYLEERQIPLVGGAGGTTRWYESPMYFAQHSANLEDRAWVRWQIQDRFAEGEKRVASLVCVEAEACIEREQDTVRYAPEHGFEVVYTGRASIGQPDFTAECLQMRNAGATIVDGVADFTFVRRIASSCARQGYRPQFVLGQAISETSFADEDLFQGSVGDALVFPFTGVDFPAAQEFHEAFARYAPDQIVQFHSATGWVAAKMFEKAAQRIGPGDEPTTEAILEGLWSMRDETLEGLVGPLTFERGKGSQAPRGCLYVMLIRDGQWVAPDGRAPTCRR